MVAPHSSQAEPAPRNLNVAERDFWQRAFLASELPALLRSGVRKLSPAGAAHLAAEYADSAIVEYRRRVHR